MATSTGSRALDFALGIGAYAPQYDLPEEAPQEGGIASALPSRGGPPSKNAEAYAPLIKEAAARHKIPYELLMGIAQTESSFNPAAIGPKTKYGTAKGMFQMIDSTARRYGVQDQFDPAQEADGAARYLSDLMKRYNGNAELAAAAYNAGEGNVDKYLSGRAPLPAQTQDYVPKVLGHAAQFGASPLAQAPQSRQPSNPIVPPPEGMQAVWLSNDTQLNAPAGLTLQQIHEKIQMNHPELENVVPTRIMQTGEQTFNVPYNMQDDEAMHHLVNQGLMKDPTEGKGGRGWNNLVSGLERSIGNAALAMGNPEMAQQFYDKAKAGEYQMYESEVEAAKRKGFLPGLKAEAMQNLVYPGMEMLGEFAPAMIPVGGVAGTAAKIAAMVPSSTGSIMQYAKERGVDLTPTEALREGIPLAAVSTVGLPLKGLGLGAGAVEKGLLRRTAEAGATNFAKNVAAMGTMEGLHKEAAGEPVLPQTPEEMARLAESAAWFAGPHALLEGAMPRERPEAPEVAQREPVRTPERVSEVVEPEVAGGPEVAPAVRTELQNIGEMYGRHVMEAEARGEPPMSPEEFMAQYKPEPVVQEEIKDELAPGDIEAAPSSAPVQPSPFVRKAQERKNAQQEPSTGAPDGGSSAQPGFREEGRDQAVGGQGVEPSGQGIKAPEIKVPEKKVATGKPPTTELAPLQERDFTPEEVQQIHAWQDEGISHRDIAKKLKIPYFNYLVKAGKVRAGEGDLGSVIKPGTMKEGEYATHAELEKLPEKDQLSYLQLMGKTKEEMGERLKLSEEEVTNKLQEYGLPDTEAELQRKMSEEKKKAIEADIEHRAQFREEEPAPVLSEGSIDRARAKNERSTVVFDRSSKRDLIKSRSTIRRRAEAKKAGTMEEVVPRAWPEIEADLTSTFNDLQRLREEKAPITESLELNQHLDFLRAEAAKGGFHNEHALWEQKQRAAEAAPKKKLNIDEQEVEQREAEEEAKKKADEERQKREEQEDQEDELDAEEQLKRDELAERKLQKKLQKKRDEEDEDVLRDLPDFDYTEPDRELDYSKGEVTKEAHTPESLAKHLADTYGARKPAVEITTRAQAGVDARTKAFYDPKTKKVHIIADNLDKGDNVHGLLKHEIGVHAQKLGVKDPEFQGILKHMQGMRDKGIQVVREAYAKVPEGTRPERVHEEALGYLVEHHPHLPLVRRFMSWLRRMAHKLTGNAGWLKPEDLSHMAHRILKKDYGVESRPERRDVQAEKLRSASDDNVRAIRATGITKTEKPLTYRETAEKVAEVAKTSYAKRRGEYIDATDPLTQALQKLDRFDKNLGKLRADLIAAEANQSVGLVAHAIENGIPVINKSGSMMVTPGANLKNAVEFARSKDKNGEELLSWVLRVNIGEHRLEEHAQDIQDLKRIAREILELKGAVKFHDKLGQNKERKLAEKALASKESAYKTIIRERNIDPETLEGREKVVNADMIALRDKLMKDHPWLKEATQEVYDAMDGLVDFQLQSGMIDKLTADKWKAAPYVPLYKSLTDLEKDPNFSKLFPRSAEAISQVKQIKGYKHAVNMLENLHKHYYGMMLPAVFNHVRRESMSQMLHLDALNRMNERPELSYEKALRKATEAVETKHSGPNTMKVLDNGEEKHYKIEDPDLLQMFAFNRPEIRGFFELARPFTAVQRTAFLKNPAFWGTQLFLDPLYANLTAGAKSLIHPGHALVNLVKIWAGKSEGAKALERHGVDIGYQAYAGKKSLSFERTGEATQFHELFGKRSAFRKAMNVLDRVHNSIDEATRVSVYNAVKKDGKKMGLTGQELEDYAVHRARTYMNFAARGRNQLLNEYRSVTAFSSAAINGADALMKNAKGYGLNEKEAAEVKRIFRNRLVTGVALGMGLSLAQLNASSDKQEGDLFDQLTSIDTGMGFKVPMKWDVGALIYGLPKVFVMTTLLDASNPNSLTASQGVKAALELIRKNMLPPMHLPDAINPIFEAGTNFDWDSLEPLESAGAMRYSADARGRSSTFLGEFFGNLFGSSGKVADHVGRSYLGKFYDYTNSIADMMTGRMEGMPGADKGLVKAVAGPFYKDEDKVTGADRIYTADEIAGQEVASFNKFKTSNKEKFEEFKNDPKRMAYRRAAPALRNARERLSAYEKQISIVMDSKMPKEAKEARIRQINENKRKAIEQGNATVKRLLGDYAP